MEDSEEAKRQREQLARYLQWVEKEGGIEGPTHLDTFFRPEQQQRLAWIKDHVEGNMMEVGCCYGFILAYCGGQIGVDHNLQSIQLARILNPKKVFYEADLRKLPFPDNFMDTVVIADCLEHLLWVDVPLGLSEAIRVASKKILITMPNAEYATRTSALFKHSFLLTQSRFEELINMLSPHQVAHERNYYWTLMEVKKLKP